MEDSFLVLTGRLTITLLEVIDLITEEEKQKPVSLTRNLFKRQVKDQYLTYATVELLGDTASSGDEEVGEAEIQLSTTCLPYSQKGRVFFGEEFLLENVKSSSRIRILLYSVNTSKSKDETYCIGYTVIPVSRLEENTTVSYLFCSDCFLLSWLIDPSVVPDDTLPNKRGRSNSYESQGMFPLLCAFLWFLCFICS
jgi:hypothetical protein